MTFEVVENRQVIFASSFYDEVEDFWMIHLMNNPGSNARILEVLDDIEAHHPNMGEFRDGEWYPY